MWKKVNGRLVCVTDKTRVRVKTYISKKQLDYLHNLADTEDTYISYLIETGLKSIVKANQFHFDKNTRLRDKTEIRLTCDEDVLKAARKFAKEYKITFTDLVQASVDYIELPGVKSKDWRHRIE